MLILPEFSLFAQTYNAAYAQVLWTTMVSDLETPVSAMLKITQGCHYRFLFESVIGGSIRDRYSFIGLNPDVIWKCHGDYAWINRVAQVDLESFEKCAQPPLVSLRQLIEECQLTLPPQLPSMAVGLFGFFGYDMVRLMERLPNTNPDPLNIPDAIFVRPTIMAIFDSINDSVFLVTPVWPSTSIKPQKAYNQAKKRLSDIIAALGRRFSYQRTPQTNRTTIVKPRSTITRQTYYQMVETAKDYIRAGDIFQVVPSQRFMMPFRLPPFSLYRALRRLNPSPFLFFLELGDFSLVGSSPEILVRVREGRVIIRPLAGTRPRGATSSEDRRLAAELLVDPKECAEHLMLLDLGRNDVGRVAQIDTVSVTEQMVIEYYSHVMHIVSNVEGMLKPELSALDALIGGFPAGTVSGAPKIRAMQIIDELETHRRSFYAGCIGYFAANGTMDTCITLRTALIKDDMMYIQAGGGVVADSQVKEEYQESINKATVLMRAAEEAHRVS